MIHKQARIVSHMKHCQEANVPKVLDLAPVVPAYKNWSSRMNLRRNFGVACPAKRREVECIWTNGFNLLGGQGVTTQLIVNLLGLAEVSREPGTDDRPLQTCHGENSELRLVVHRG